MRSAIILTLMIIMPCVTACKHTPKNTSCDICARPVTVLKIGVHKPLPDNTGIRMISKDEVDGHELVARFGLFKYAHEVKNRQDVINAAMDMARKLGGDRLFYRGSFLRDQYIPEGDTRGYCVNFEFDVMKKSAPAQGGTGAGKK
jgi:hypothetical protein